MERADRVSAETDKPFDHEARMQELLLRQAEHNAALDLNKNETQVVPRGEQDSARLKSSRPRGSSAFLGSRPRDFSCDADLSILIRTWKR
jgi:hypothetical protein